MPYILESGCEGHKKNGLLSCLAIWFRYTDQICMISIHRHWTYWTSQYSADWRRRSHEGSGELRLPAKLVQVSTRGKYWWKRLGKRLGKRLDKKVKYWITMKNTGALFAQCPSWCVHSCTLFNLFTPCSPNISKPRRRSGSSSDIQWQQHPRDPQGKDDWNSGSGAPWSAKVFRWIKTKISVILVILVNLV